MNIEKSKKVNKCGCIGEAFNYYENEIRKLKLGIVVPHPQCNATHFLPLHKEKDINIFFANSSSEIHQIGNKEIIVQKGMYNILNPEQIFGGKDKKKIEIPKQDIELVIHPSIFENVLEELNLKKPNCGLEFDINPQKKSQWLDMIIKILISSLKDSEGFGSTLLIEQSLLQLVTVLLKEHPNSIQQLMKKDPKVLKYDTRIQKALDYLRDNYNQNFSLEELAKESALSKRHLIRLFQKETGKTPYEYLILYRINKSIELLKNTNKSIQEIAEETGFTDATHLWKVFIKHFGKSPSAFR
jgi:AraC-like DNA-binding protein